MVPSISHHNNSIFLQDLVMLFAVLATHVTRLKGWQCGSNMHTLNVLVQRLHWQYRVRARSLYIIVFLYIMVTFLTYISNACHSFSWLSGSNIYTLRIGREKEIVSFGQDLDSHGLQCNVGSSGTGQLAGAEVAQHRLPALGGRDHQAGGQIDGVPKHSVLGPDAAAHTRAEQLPRRHSNAATLPRVLLSAHPSLKISHREDAAEKLVWPLPSRGPCWKHVVLVGNTCRLLKGIVLAKSALFPV